MSLLVFKGATFLVAILVSTLVASQSVLPSASSSEPSLRSIPQQDYDDAYYTDAETSCIKYCRSRLFGTVHCCPPSVMRTGGGLIDCSAQNVDCTGVSVGSQIDCTTHSVGCRTRQPPKVTRFCRTSQCNPIYPPVIRPTPVITQDPVIFQQPTVTRFCGTSQCNPTYPTIIRQTPVITQDQVIYRQPTVTKFCGTSQCNPSYPSVIQETPVIEENHVIYQDQDYFDAPVIPETPTVYTSVIHRRPVYTSPKFVCKNPICNPVLPRRPTVCTGSSCPQPPRLPVIPPSTACNRPDLVETVNQLIIRSYSLGYTLQTFIDGIQGIVNTHWQYSWYGHCIAPGKVQFVEDSDEVDVFEGQDIPTAHCRPCSTRPSGTRWCSTQFQTILSACDRCCHSATFRTRRSLLSSRGDLREGVAQLVARAREMQRQEFIAHLKAILRGAAQGFYSWKQTAFVKANVFPSNPRTTQDREDVFDEVTPTTAQPLAEAVTEQNTSDSDSESYDDS